MGWKEELKASYDALANDDINASNKEFAKTKSQSWNNALGRGMQRSSYLNATQANYDKSAVDAANQIRNKYNAAYKQAEMEEEERRWQRELAQEQLRLQQEAQALARQQAEWGQSNWQAEFNWNKEQAAAKAASSSPSYTPSPKTTPTAEPAKPTDAGLLGNINGSKKATTYYAQDSSFYGSDSMYRLLKDTGRL